MNTPDFILNFNDPKHIHFIGIGGISMSGLAELLCDRGFTVSGSDSSESDITHHLSSLGISITYGQSADNITDDIDAVVYTAAVHPDNPEFAAAVAKGLPILSRATLLGQIMTHYKDAVAVSGTHGKTTTTSMLSYVYLKAGFDPTISVGGILQGIKGNIRIGHSEHFITEACEYTNSFLEFFPTTAIVLNVEAEHLDFFKDINDIRSSFRRFVNIVPNGGLVVINSEIPSYGEICASAKGKVVTFGLSPDSDYTACDISFNDLGHGQYTLVRHGKKVGKISLSVVGIHNISNSLAVCAAALEQGIDFSDLSAALTQFTGTDRRFQYKGSFNGVTVIDDYAHHPTEIRATLTAARQCKFNKLWVAFQPHTYSRTKSFLQDFADVLSIADAVVLADIYAAREKDPGDISSADIAELIRQKGCEAYYFKNFEEIEKFLIHNCTTGDMLITMGAGNIVNVGDSLLRK